MQPEPIFENVAHDKKKGERHAEGCIRETYMAINIATSAIGNIGGAYKGDVGMWKMDFDALPDKCAVSVKEEGEVDGEEVDEGRR